jgi:hypothetical protein
MSRPRQDREPVVRLPQEAATACPSLLEPPCPSRDVGALLRRGVRHRKGSDELLVGFVPAALLWLADAAKDEVRDRAVQDPEQERLIDSVCREDSVDAYVVEVATPRIIGTDPHPGNG